MIVLIKFIFATLPIYLNSIIKKLIEKHKTNFKGVGQPLRIGLVGSRFGTGLYDVILSLDKTEGVKRLNKI